MNIKKRFFRTAVAITVASSCSNALAAGFQLNEHSASGLGRAFAGDAAIAENASVIARNPASMSQFDTTAFSIVFHYINPSVDIQGSSTSLTAEKYNQIVEANGLEAAGFNKLTTTHDISVDDVAPAELIPNAYFLTPLNDKIHLGIGGFANYGLSTEYPSDYAASEHADYVSIVTYNLNPSLSYKLSDTLSIGVGGNILYADAKMITKTPDYFTEDAAAYAALNQFLTSIGQAENAIFPSYLKGGMESIRMKGDDIAFGWNAGVLWQATDVLRVSLAYRSKIAIALEGDVSSDIITYPQPYVSTGKLEIDLPEQLELALHYEFDDQLSAQFSAHYTGWNSFQELTAMPDDHAPIQLKEVKFGNTWRYSVGGTYKLNNQWTLRAGYSLDNSAANDEHRSIAIPDTDRHWLSFGSSYKLSEHATFDFAYCHIFATDDAPVNEASHLNTVLNAELSQADVHILSAQMNYQF